MSCFLLFESVKGFLCRVMKKVFLFVDTGSVVDPDPEGSETFCRIRIRNSRLWIRIRIQNWT
jgi:hypothetical protein